MSNTRSLSKLSAAEKNALILELAAAKVSQLEQLVGDLREELARLKGRKGRPQIKPSGMEAVTTPKPAGKRDK